MTDISASHRSIRVQLESNFDDYLATIVDYLHVEYSELQLPQELLNELAATVIVRVSHAKPEPADLDAALVAAADELMAVRRPQLSSASRASGASVDFTSDFPASVPSLRLIQRPRRRAALDDASEADVTDALSSGRLSLADPPTDLSKALGLSSERTSCESEPEPEPVSETQKSGSTSAKAAQAISEPDPIPAQTRPATETDAGAARPSTADPEENALGAQPSATEVQAKTRRKITPPQAEGRRKRSRVGKRTARLEVPSAPDLGLRSHSIGSSAAQTLPDEIAMLAMMGFPSNPNRAARLCVVALAEELEIEPAADLSSQIERVTRALECLSSTLLYADLEPRHAAMEWQRAARKATLQAFFCDRI